MAGLILGATLLTGILGGGLALWALPRGRSGTEASSTLAARLLARDPVTTRVHAYLTAGRLFRGSPVWGVGPGRFDAAMWKRLDEKLSRSAGDAPSDEILASPFFLEKLRGTSHGHAHNELLHAAAERGLLGLGALLLAWGAAMGAALQKRDFALAGRTRGGRD
jgi:O-antigen ligase